MKCKQDDHEGGSAGKADMYLQFDLVLSDVSAFLVDGDYHWSQNPSDKNDVSADISGVCFLPIIDKCGVILKLQQVILSGFFIVMVMLSQKLKWIGKNDFNHLIKIVIFPLMCGFELSLT